VRRAILVMSATVVGLIAVLSFHTTPAKVTIGGVSSSQTKPTPTTTPAAGAPPTTTGPPNSATTTPSTPTTQPGTQATAPTTTRTATGPVVNYSWGTISVAVTVSGTKITDVKVASLNDGGNPQSQNIDSQSIPMLISQAKAAQSANIQGVSGASYTSQGFTQSLQSALAKLGIK
jgi:uncharacterized protein with FMN-binding domain